MLFPNRPPAPEMTPGMGYAPGANAMGYAPGARGVGYVAHMGYAPGARGLGAVSDAQMQAAWDAGLDGPTLDALSAAGATDADIRALMAGTTDVPTLMSKYAGLVTTEGTSVTNTISPGSASSAGAGQIPGGSTLLYTCTVNTPPLTSAQNIIDAMTSHLPSHGMSMVSSQVTQSGSVSGPASFSMTVMDSVGNALVSDAKSVLDGLVQNYLGPGNLQLQSSVTVVSPGTTATGLPAPNSATNLAMWLENNILYIGLGIGGLIFLNNFTGKRR